MTSPATASSPRKASPPSPTFSSAPAPAPDEPPDSLLARYLTTPLFFASFLLSFLLVDNRNHTHAHPQSSPKTHSNHNNHNGAGATEPWFWRAKHRRLARLEIGQALEMRRLVVLGMVVGVGIACGAAWCVGWWVVGRVLGGR
ncbi:hypothetical protein MMC11_004541 [Xylographa trunciseda]|nr:hypothetical protein [Xylographa trunciseda]